MLTARADAEAPETNAGARPAKATSSQPEGNTVNTGAEARSIAAEMHSGFSTMRNEMTMCIRERLDVRPGMSVVKLTPIFVSPSASPSARFSRGNTRERKGSG